MFPVLPTLTPDFSTNNSFRYKDEVKLYHTPVTLTSIPGKVMEQLIQDVIIKQVVIFEAICFLLRAGAWDVDTATSDDGTDLQKEKKSAQKKKPC